MATPITPSSGSSLNQAGAAAAPSGAAPGAAPRRLSNIVRDPPAQQPQPDQPLHRAARARRRRPASRGATSAGVVGHPGEDRRGLGEAAARHAHPRARPERGDERVVPQPGPGPDPGHRCWSTADGGALSVLARSVHHHGGGAGRAGRHPLDAGAHRHHAQRRVADGRDHGASASRSRTRSCWSTSPTTSASRTKLSSARGRARGGQDAPAAGADDGAGDDPRHAARWRSRSARAASRTRRSGARSSAACSWRPSSRCSSCRSSTRCCATKLPEQAPHGGALPRRGARKTGARSSCTRRCRIHRPPRTSTPRSNRPTSQPPSTIRRLLRRRLRRAGRGRRGGGLLPRLHPLARRRGPRAASARRSGRGPARPRRQRRPLAAAARGRPSRARPGPTPASPCTPRSPATCARSRSTRATR